MMNSSNETLYCDWKVVFLGESSVGKSSIITRYNTGTFNRDNATIGAAFTVRRISFMEDRVVNLEIWDTAGQERYRSLTPMYYRNTDVAVIVFDVTVDLQKSLGQVKSWVDELNGYVESKNGEDRNHGIQIILVANKIDLFPTDDTLDREQMEMFISEWPDKDLKYVQVSAKNGVNIDALFNKTIVGCIPRDKFVPKKLNNSKTKGNVTLNNGIVRKNNQYNMSGNCNC